MATKNAVYKVDNGDGSFDELMFKTVEDMIKGQKQKLFYGQGYRFFPGGLLLQWGYVNNLKSSTLNQVNLPIKLKDYNYVVLITPYGGPNKDSIIKATYQSESGFKIQSYVEGTNAYWLAVSFV